MRRIAPSVESQPDRLEDVRTRIKDAIVFADPSDTGTRHRGVLLHNAWRHRGVLSRTLGITDRMTPSPARQAATSLSGRGRGFLELGAGLPVGRCRMTADCGFPGGETTPVRTSLEANRTDRSQQASPPMSAFGRGGSPP